YAWVGPRQLPDVVAVTLETARSWFKKASDAVPVATRLFDSAVPTEPRNAVALGCSTGGAQMGLVASVSPAPVDARDWVMTDALVNCACEQLALPIMPPLTVFQLFPSP